MKEFRFGAIAKKRLDIQFELAKELFVSGCAKEVFIYTSNDTLPSDNFPSWANERISNCARKCFEAASIFIAVADDITNEALSQCNDETE